jgi:cobalt-zinc-cadmium resistance protein CzcA
MLENIVGFSIRFKAIVILACLGLVVAGVISYLQLPIEAFPDVLNQNVQVITQIPGQASQDVERMVTIPLEKEFTGIPKVIQSRSISEFGLSVVYLTFDDNVDGYWARAQTLEKIGTADIPAGIAPSLAPMSAVTGEILRYEVTSPTLNLTEMRTLQDWTLEKQFRSVPGIADVSGYGGLVKTIEVGVDPLKLYTYGIPIRSLADTLSNAGVSTGGNMIDWPNQSFVVRSDGEVKSLDDLRDVGIIQRGSTAIRVRDVAKVFDSFAPIRGVVGRDDRDQIVQGIVLLRKDDNPVVTGHLLRDKIKELNGGTLLPEGVKLKKYYDRMELVSKTTNTVGHNLLEGIFLVVLVLFLFLQNLPATLLVTAVVPLSLLFAFFMMKMSHTPANLISLGSLDFGIIIDGALIIVEYVLVQTALLKSRTEEVIQKSVTEIVRSVFFSMCMIILAYLPIFTLERVEGRMFNPLAWTISYALLGALIISLTLIPTLLPWVLELSEKKLQKSKLPPEGVISKIQFKVKDGWKGMLIKAGFNKDLAANGPYVPAPHDPLHSDASHDEHEPAWLTRLRKRYLAFMHAKVFHEPKRVLLVATGVAALGVIIFMFSGSEFIPELDEGALWIRASFPHSSSLNEGIVLARQVRKMVKQNEEVRTVVSQLGGPEDGTDPNLFDNCEFFVDLKPKEEWTRFHDREQLMEEMRKQFLSMPGVSFNISQPIADNVEEAISGVKGKNAIKFYGPDLAELQQLSDSTQKLLHSVPGVVDIGEVASMPMVPQLTIRINRARVAQAGVALQDINDLIEIAIGGKKTTVIYDGETKINVIVRADERYRSRIDQIKKLPVPMPNGKATQLESLADISLKPGPLVINRESGFRRVGVKFNVEGRDLGTVMKEVMSSLDHLKIPSGYSMQVGGESENQKRAMKRLSMILPATAGLLGILLFILFARLDWVLKILGCLFLSTTGSVALLFLRGIPFSVPAAVGILVLFGLMALDSVALTSAYAKWLELGQSKQRAIEKACGERFRPILMTSCLAGLGLLPAAISHGIGAETQRPLATAVLGGIFTGLPMVLFLLPVLLGQEFKNPLNSAWVRNAFDQLGRIVAKRLHQRGQS